MRPRVGGREGGRPQGLRARLRETDEPRPAAGSRGHAVVRGLAATRGSGGERSATGPRSEAKQKESEEEKAGGRESHVKRCSAAPTAYDRTEATVRQETDRQTEMTLLTLVWGQPAPCLNVDCTSDRWRFIYKFHVFDTGPSLDSLLWVSASWSLPPPPSARLAACHADPRCHQPCWPGHAQQGTWRTLRLLDCLPPRHRCACPCGGCGARLSSPGPGRQVLTPCTMSHRHPNGTGHINAFAAVGHCAEW